MKNHILRTTITLALAGTATLAAERKQPVRKTSSTSTSTSLVSKDGHTQGSVTVTINKDGHTEVKTWKIGNPNKVYVTPTRSLPNQSKMEKVSWLGIAITDVSDDIRTQLPIVDESGIRIRSVIGNSPAEKAGLRADDLIYRVDEQIIFNIPQFQSLIRTYKAETEIEITFFRKGKQQTVTAKPVLKEMLIDRKISPPLQFTQPNPPNWRRLESTPNGTQRFRIESAANDARLKIEAHRKKLEEWVKSTPKNRAFIVRPDGKATYVQDLEKTRIDIRKNVEESLRAAGVSEQALKDALKALDGSFKKPGN